MEEKRKTSQVRIKDGSDAEEVERKLTGTIGDLLINYGHGISEEDKLLSRKDKNAVDFVLNYSKLWCKCLKDLVVSLEKRALYENECMRAVCKLFQGLESGFTSTNGAPLCEETLQLSRMMIEQAKEIELHNTKRCRELLEVLNRQRTEFTKTRKFLKTKWKADVKRMVDAESALFKSKAAYFSRCQTGVKLREELATAQALLNEMQANLVATCTAPSSPLSPGGNSGTTAPGGAEAGSSVESGLDATPAGPALMNQVVKQKAKVERLEKQLADNDKKEIELMYSYKEAVEVANTRLCDLEKSKVEIICDTRLTVLKCDEVVSDSMAELISHLFVTRTKMLGKYESLAMSFQNYQPCKPYQQLLQSHIEKGTDVILEKYQFEGYHDIPTSATVKDRHPWRRGDASFGKFVSRFAQFYAKDNAEASDGLRGQLHSDSDSDQEEAGTTNAARGNSGTVLSSLVEFGSNLFRPDFKKASVRSKQRSGVNATSAAAASTTAEDQAVVAALEAAMEKEYDEACYIIAQCANGIECQPSGPSTLGIYRVPASKVKVAALLERIRPAQEASYACIDLSDEHPLTLASAIKTKLISLPEPLLSYGLYDKFVEVGKSLDTTDQKVVDEKVKVLGTLFAQLTPSNWRLAGLLFHHLKRISGFQTENQMGQANLATMFGPTLLRQRPKFQVANMMEFVDNKWLMKVVEVAIDKASDIFGPTKNFSMGVLLKELKNATVTREQQTQKEIPSITSPKLSRDDYFADFIAEAPEASPSTRPAAGRIGKPLPLYTPYSERVSPLMTELDQDKSTASKPFEDTLKVTSFSGQYSASPRSSTSSSSETRLPTQSPVPTPAKPVTTKPPQQQPQQPKSATGASESASAVSGLKRLVSAKAYNIQQHFQQLTGSSSNASSSSNANSKADPRSPSSGVSSLVIGQSKIGRSKSSRSSGSRNSTPDKHQKTTAFNIPDCSYIDNDQEA
ncbi:hypothetical protein AAHC03_016493 [Spirometra sp. Aus1]